MAHVMFRQKLFAVVIVFVLYVLLPINARICQDVHAPSRLYTLEGSLRGCTTVIGNLKIVLQEYESSRINNISFPELTEVTGFLLFFRVYGLTSIGNLFPNLVVIRGDTLLTNYALVIHSLPNLKDINLYNLRYIERGSTRIERCPNLCFVDDINWDRIGNSLHSLHYFNENENTCKWCAEECNGYCWNEHHCHEIQPIQCDAQCLACDPYNVTNCISCKTSYYLNQGKCLSECPENKVKNSETRTCMTEQECDDLYAWWVFQGECIRRCPEGYEEAGRSQGWCRYCGENCKKVCRGGYIKHVQHARVFRQCTHINGSLVFSGNGLILAEELEESFRNVKEIWGYLKIHELNALGSLDFLGNLKIIKGEKLVSDRYALVIIENNNLHKLWTAENFTLKINKGDIYCHNNPQLCFSEVERLVNVTRISNVTTFDVSSYSNGDRKNCKEVDLKVLVKEVTSTSAYVKWDEIDLHTNDTIIGYSLHYSPDPFGNMTNVYEETECSYTTWSSVFVTTNSYHIPYLAPYTRYVFYIEIHTMQRMLDGQTSLKHFVTLSADPGPIELARAASTESSILLVWKPPILSNGILSYYEISTYVMENKQHIVTQRNYCKYPHKFLDEKLVDEVDVPFDFGNDCCEKQHEEAQSKDRLVEFHLLQNDNKPIIVNSTRVKLTSLHHFEIYSLFIRACNNVGCSPSIMIHQRTKPKLEADDIPSNITYFVFKNDVVLKWLEPVDPNSIIVSYELHYVRKDTVYILVPNKECVTQTDYLKNNYSYVLTNLLPGRYSLMITAVSLAGPGRASESIEFEIIQSLPFDFTVLGACILGVILILIVISLYFWFHLKTSKKLIPLATNTDSLESLYELSRNDIDINTRLTPGVICNGFIKSQNRPCTVISGQEYDKHYKLSQFLKEVSAMKNSKGHHIVNLLGVVSAEQPPLIITELMAWGDLKSFLRKPRDLSEDLEELTDADMYRMAAEIADGIFYLNYKQIVPRDLAARNCLVSAGLTIKIANFSITKDLYIDDYQQKENGDVIPVRWMSPESLAHNVFTCNSNVWSFGIILWEIVTLGQQPYGNLSNDDVIKYVVSSKKILDPPDNYPDLLYEMMVACWRWKPNDRPSFVSLLEQLKSNVSKNFRLVSFYHSKEVRKYKESLIKDKEGKSPIIGKKSVVRWKKNDDEDTVQLLSAEELPSQNEPSTSRYV